MSETPVRNVPISPTIRLCRNAFESDWMTTVLDTVGWLDWNRVVNPPVGLNAPPPWTTWIDRGTWGGIGGVFGGAGGAGGMTMSTGISPVIVLPSGLTWKKKPHWSATTWPRPSYRPRLPVPSCWTKAVSFWR